MGIFVLNPLDKLSETILGYSFKIFLHVFSCVYGMFYKQIYIYWGYAKICIDRGA